MVEPGRPLGDAMLPIGRRARGDDKAYYVVPREYSVLKRDCGLKVRGAENASVTFGF